MQTRVKIILCVIACFLIFTGGFYYCFSQYKEARALDKKYEETYAELKNLQKELKGLQQDYETEVSQTYEKDVHVSLGRYKTDRAFLKKYLTPCFNWTDAKSYEKARSNLLSISPKDSVLFEKYLVENSKDLMGNEISRSGMKTQLNRFDVIPKTDGGRDYYVILGYLPYLNDDNYFM